MKTLEEIRKIREEKKKRIRFKSKFKSKHCRKTYISV